MKAGGRGAVARFRGEERYSEQLSLVDRGRVVSMKLDATKLVGLLAEPARLRVVAALVLQPDSADGVAQRTGMERRDVVVALERLAGSGLVRRRSDGMLSVVQEVFASAAREAASAADTRSEARTEDERFLERLVQDGRISHIPARQNKKLVLLDWLAQRFEPGRRYAEREVNDLLLQSYDDYAALRRLLVDFHFLDRAGGMYWRCGGSVGTPELDGVAVSSS